MDGYILIPANEGSAIADLLEERAVDMDCLDDDADLIARLRTPATDADLLIALGAMPTSTRGERDPDEVILARDWLDADDLRELVGAAISEVVDGDTLNAAARVKAWLDYRAQPESLAEVRRA